MRGSTQRHDKRTSALSAINLHHGRNYWWHSTSHPCHSYRPLLVENRDLCLPHLYSTPPLWIFQSEYNCHNVWWGKTTMVQQGGYPTVKKILRICPCIRHVPVFQWRRHTRYAGCVHTPYKENTEYFFTWFLSDLYVKPARSYVYIVKQYTRWPKALWACAVLF